MKITDIISNLKERKQREKIDLLLVHCDLFYELEFSSINMGLVYISTYMEKKGYRVEILSPAEMFKMSRYQTGKWVRRRMPAIVGFYTVSDNYELVKDLARDIKKWLPSAVIIAGGPLASAMGENMMRDFPFDMVITGEGEFALEIVADAIIKGKGNIADAEGIIFRKGDKIIHGKPAKPIEDLDSLPFPDRKYFKNQQVFQVVSGRGCPYKCAFCFQAGHGLKFRFRSAENVAEEITKNLDSMPVVGFDFIDDAFIMDAGRCVEIARKIVEYRKKTRRDFIFFCQGRANIIDKHREIIPALYHAGLAKIQLGIESGDPDTLKLYRKQVTTDQVRRTVQHIRDTGHILVVGGFILGGPRENEKTFANTLNLAEELIESAPGIFETSAGFLGAYPGTEISANLSRFGLKIEEEDFIKGLSLSDVQMSTRDFDKDSIRKLEGRFYDRVIKTMRRNLHRIPRDLIRRHYQWVDRYKIYSLWYLFFLGKLDVVKSYFKFLDSPRFRDLSRLPPDEISFWRPMRVQEKRNYNADGSLKLPESINNKSIEDDTLRDPDEILVYELSSGKLTVGEAVRRFCRERKMTGSENEIFINLFLPLYKKLDETYRLVFFR